MQTQLWVIYALSAAAVWGLDYSLSERIFQAKVSPLTLLTLNVVISALIIPFFCSSVRLKRDLVILQHDPKTLIFVLISVVGFSIGNYLSFLSVEAKNATLATLIELCYPVFVVMFTWLIFRESHLSLSVLIGALLIIGGVFVISYFQ